MTNIPPKPPTDIGVKFASATFDLSRFPGASLTPPIIVQSEPPQPAPEDADRFKANVQAYIDAHKAFEAATTFEDKCAAHDALVQTLKRLPRETRPKAPPRPIKVDVITDTIALYESELRRISTELAQAVDARDDKRQADLLVQAALTKAKHRELVETRDYLKKHATTEADPVVFRGIKEILARKSETEWLPGLDEILEGSVLAILAAPRETFKSFIALDWGMRAAVEGCGVIMLSGEGAGLDRRIDAWLKVHGQGVDVDKLKFAALEKPIALNDAAVLAMVADRIKALGWSPDLVIVDTSSKFTPGLEENDNTENAEFMAALSATIRHQFDATVLLIDHTGQTEQHRPRGAYSKMANNDAEYIAARPDPHGYTVTVTRERFKDYEQLPKLVYTGKVVDLERRDRHGHSVTSLAFTRSSAPPPASNGLSEPTGKNQKLMLAEVKARLAATPRPEGVPAEVPEGVPCISWEAAVEVGRGKLPADPERYRERARDALKALVHDGHLTMGSNWLWLPLPPPPPSGIPVPDAIT